MTQASQCIPAAQPSQASTPLRQRMIEDMRMRRFAEKTQAQYIRAVVRLTRFLGASPDTAGEEDLRRFQLHVVDHGATPQTLVVHCNSRHWPRAADRTIQMAAGDRSVGSTPNSPA